MDTNKDRRPGRLMLRERQLARDASLLKSREHSFRVSVLTFEGANPSRRTKPLAGGFSADPDHRGRE